MLLNTLEFLEFPNLINSFIIFIEIVETMNIRKINLMFKTNIE